MKEVLGKGLETEEAGLAGEEETEVTETIKMTGAIEDIEEIEDLKEEAIQEEEDTKRFLYKNKRSIR